jgi:hypothetical protein
MTGGVLRRKMTSLTGGHVNISGHMTWAFARGDEKASYKHTLSSLYTLYWIALIQEFFTDSTRPAYRDFSSRFFKVYFIDPFRQQPRPCDCNNKANRSSRVPSNVCMAEI